MSNFPDYKLSIGTPHTAEPYLSPIPRKKLKTLMQRQNKIPLRDYSLWIISLIIAGGAVTLAYNAGSWLVIPAMLVYGILYGGAAHSRIHECGHGTPFRTLWLNTLFHHMASFMCLKNLHAWKWSHAKHHTHTIIVAQDPEIAFPRPPNLLAHASNLLNIAAGVAELRRLVFLSRRLLAPPSNIVSINNLFSNFNRFEENCGHPCNCLYRMRTAIFDRRRDSGVADVAADVAVETLLEGIFHGTISGISGRSTKTVTTAAQASGAH